MPSGTTFTVIFSDEVEKLSRATVYQGPDSSLKEEIMNFLTAEQVFRVRTAAQG
jgi:hypothetical protein